MFVVVKGNAPIDLWDLGKAESTRITSLYMYIQIQQTAKSYSYFLANERASESMATHFDKQQAGARAPPIDIYLLEQVRHRLYSLAKLHVLYGVWWLHVSACCSSAVHF
jgi:hypothetical protein